MLSFSSEGDVIIFHGVHVIIVEGPDVIIFKCRGYYQFSGVNVINFEGLDDIIFHGVNVIIFEGLDVIIFKCWGCYNFYSVNVIIFEFLDVIFLIVVDVIIFYDVNVMITVPRKYALFFHRLSILERATDHKCIYNCNHPKEMWVGFKCNGLVIFSQTGGASKYNTCVFPPPPPPACFTSSPWYPPPSLPQAPLLLGGT
jgi:hypothetical protein